MSTERVRKSPIDFLRSFRRKFESEERREKRERKEAIIGVRERTVRLNDRLKNEHKGALELENVDWEESRLTDEARTIFASEFERPEGITSLRVCAGIDEPSRTSTRSIQIQLNRRKTWFVNVYTSAWTHGEGGISVSLQCQSYGGQTQKGHEAMKTASTKFYGKEYNEFERFDNRFKAAESILDFIEDQLGSAEE